MTCPRWRKSTALPGLLDGTKLSHVCTIIDLCTSLVSRAKLEDERFFRRHDHKEFSFLELLGHETAFCRHDTHLTKAVAVIRRFNSSYVLQACMTANAYGTIEFDASQTLFASDTDASARTQFSAAVTYASSRDGVCAVFKRYKI
jgi:hypothetical protein